MQVCACHLSLQSITLLLAHSPLFLLLLLLSLLLLFLVAVVAVAADDHIAAISAALVAAVAAAATAFAAAVTAAVWCCCCLVLLLLLLLLLLLRVGMHPPAYTGKTMYRHTKIHTYIRQTNKQIDTARSMSVLVPSQRHVGGLGRRPLLSRFVLLQGLVALAGPKNIPRSPERQQKQQQQQQ